VDKDLYFKLEDLAPVQYINKPLYYYRHHSGSISLGKGAGLADMYELAVRSDALLRNKVSGKFPAINSLSLDDLTHGILYVSFDLLSKGFIFSALIFIMKAFRLNPKYFHVCCTENSCGLNKRDPDISIIIPCYNQAVFLPDALESVMNQTHLNWECIVVNDGSIDRTEEVALNWVRRDHRFIYLKKENGGLSSARNMG
jgi:hypothetical protein